MSEPDELILRPPVFESKFMRELDMETATSMAATLQQRPGLAASYSSPAAVPSSKSAAPSPTGSNHSSNSNSNSLKSRLVRVASSSSLFGRSLSHLHHNNAHVTQNSTTASNPASPTIGTSPHGHRKTTSLAVGSSTPSPRARLAASISTNGHKHRHSEDVRHLYLPTSTIGANDMENADQAQEPLSPRLRSILGNKDANAIASNDKWQRSKESLLSLGSLGRKRSMDGLSSVNGTSSIQEEQEDDHVSVSEKPEDRPALGNRLYSHDRTTEVTNAASSYAVKSTPAFPRVPLNPPSTLSTSTSAHAGISSGLSESSRRFRSAFRLNKGRATPGPPGAGDAPGTGGPSVRRAMRVPLSQQQQEEEERDEEERSNAMLSSRADASEASTSANEKSKRTFRVECAEVWLNAIFK